MLFDPLFQAPLAVIEPPVDQDAFGIEQQAERRGELSVAPAIGRMALNLHVRFAYDPEHVFRSGRHFVAVVDAPSDHPYDVIPAGHDELAAFVRELSLIHI